VSAAGSSWPPLDDPCGTDTAGANAFGVDGITIGAFIGGALNAGASKAGALNDAGIGSGDTGPWARTAPPPTTAIGPGVRSGLSGAAIGSVDGVRTVAGGAYDSKTGERDGTDVGDDDGETRGAERGADGTDGASDGAERGADGADGASDGARGATGAIPERGGIEPAFGASLMRVVAGATLAGPLLTGGATLTGTPLLTGAALSGARSFASCARARPISGESPCAVAASSCPLSASGTGCGGGFAAGATPVIVLLIFERAVPPGRGIREPISALCFRPSEPTAAPMRNLK
jgi:hypothetical protein